MLLEGEIEACYWNHEGRIETESLSERGDLVVFRPGQAHALFVKRDSHIIVVRFFPDGDSHESSQRVEVSLPGKLEILREKALDPRCPLEAIIPQIDKEIERIKK